MGKCTQCANVTLSNFAVDNALMLGSHWTARLIRLGVATALILVELLMASGLERSSFVNGERSRQPVYVAGDVGTMPSESFVG
jgi:hypothetical protein